MVVKKTIPEIQKEKKPKEPQKAPIPEVFLKPKEPSPSNKPSDVLKHYWGFDSFRPFQEEIINSVIEGEDVFVIAGTSFGKALHKDTVIQTPYGQSTMKHIMVGDLVLGKDGKPTKVLAKYQPMVEDHYKITFKNGEVVKACGDHLWQVNIPRLTENKEVIINTRKMFEITEKNKTKLKNGTKKIISISVSEAVQYEEQDVNVNPYLLGCWIGDGTKGGCGITSSSEDFVFYKSYFESLNYVVTSRTTSNTVLYTVSNYELGWDKKTHLLNCIRKKVFKDKELKLIPQEYIYNSVQKRLDLLAGLLDTDGCVELNAAVFYNTNKKLIEQVRFLAHSLGLRTTLTSKTGSYKDKNGNKINCKICYSLRIISDKFNLFKLPRKYNKFQKILDKNTLRCHSHYIENIEKVIDNKADYYCITVDNNDHLYLITDSFIATHNTACFQVPTMCMEGITIVISPLIALQADQVTNSQAIGIPAACLNSELGIKEKRTLLHLLQNKLVKLLYVAPETFFSEGFVPFYETLKQQKINFIAVDESHSASQYSDFRPAYTRIHEARDMFPGIPLLAVTATADRRIKTDILKYCGFTNKYEEFKVPLDRSNLKYNISFDQLSISTQCLEIIKKFSKDTAGIIYFNTRKSAEEITKFLKMCGYDVTCYHAGLKKTDKNKAQEDFKNGTVKIMCATTAFGMGVDARVDYVICAQTSQSMEDLIQAWGRSGRSGKDAHCYLLYNAKDKNTCDFLIRASTKNSERLRIKLNKLHSFHSFCTSNTCIRKGILEYFGEQYNENNCGSCSVCLKKLTK